MPRRAGPGAPSRTSVLIGSVLALSVVLGLILGLRLGRAAPAPLRLGAIAFPGYEGFFLAEKLGYYPRGCVQLVDFASSTESLRAYQNRALDLVALTLDEALRLAEHDDHRIILVTDVSSGADAIMARADIERVADLRGKRVAVELNALGTFFLARTLAKAGMTTRDVQLVPSAIFEHLALYDRGAVDVVVSFEPNRTHLLHRGAKVLFDSAQLPNEIVDVLVSRRETLERSPALVQQLLAAWFRAQQYARERPLEAARLVAKREALAPTEFLASLAGLTIPDRRQTLRLLDPRRSPLLATFDRLNATMVEAGIFDKPVQSRGLLWDGPVRALGAP